MTDLATVTPFAAQRPKLAAPPELDPSTAPGLDALADGGNAVPGYAAHRDATTTADVLAQARARVEARAAGQAKPVVAGQAAPAPEANAVRPAAAPAAPSTAAPAAAAPAPGPEGEQPGLLAPGNIDLAKRPVVPNGEDFSTVRAMSFEQDGQEILVPTVSPDGKLLNTDDAIALYRKTGQFLGKFDTPENATAYAQKLHDAQAAFYGSGGGADGAVVPAPASAAKPKTMIEALINPGPAGPGAQYQGGDNVAAMKTMAVEGGKTAIEVPRALWRGLVDAASNLEQSFFGLGKGQTPGGDGLLFKLTPEQKAKLGAVNQVFLQGLADAPDKIVAAPKSVGGNLIAGIVQFIAGQRVFGKALEAAGAGTGLLQNMAAGGGSMATAFKVSDDTLSEMIQSNPDLANPVTGFLSSKPGDSDAVKRLKNFVEGATGEGLAAAFMKGMTLYKAAKAPLPQEGATAAPNTLDLPALAPERDFLLLGDPKAPLLRVTPKGEGVLPKLGTAMEKTGGVDQGAAAAALTKDAQAARLEAALDVPVDYGNKSVYVNFSKINSEADVKLALGQMTEAFSSEIAEAQRGVRSNAQTQKAADALGMDVADVLKRRNGQPFNAEEAVAARQLLAASGSRLLAAAQKAAAPGATAADQFVFRKMMATHYAIQAEVIGARTETARALQSWSIPAGGGQEQMKALEALLQGTGGSDVSQAMAKRLALLAQSGADAATLNQAIRKGAFATTMDAVKEIWINGLLSSPTTHIVNTASNLNVAMQQVGERWVAGRIAQATGSGGVADGEAQAMMYGMLSGLGDALKASWQTMRGTAAGDLSKLETPREPAVSAKAFNLDEAGGPGRVVDLLGSVFRVPGKALETQDAFFKSIGYRMELHAQAFRQASSEGLSGDQLGKRVAQLVNDPPENIKLASADAALYNTFTNENGAFGKNLQRLRNGGGALNPLPFIIPFVRTPINIARYSFERTPLAPLVGQWRADIASGGARKDIALARMATGSASMAIATDYAMQGLVSGRGPKDAGEREALVRTGWQPYSMKIGGKWYGYNRLDPFGQTLGFAADMTEAMSRGEIDPGDVEQWNEVMAGGIAAVSQFTVNKTYLKGLADFANMMTDPDRYGKGYVDSQAASFLPFTSGLSAAERYVDPTQRDANTPMEAMLARIPGLSDRVQPALDLWGKEKKADAPYGRAVQVLSPIAVSEVKSSPIDDEMLKQRVFQDRIGKKVSFKGVPVNFSQWPEVYTAYVKLAGNGAKDPAFKLGAKDYLDQVVGGKHQLSQIYAKLSDGPDGTKAAFIKDTIQNYRKLAQDQVLADPKFAKFAHFIKAQQDQQMQQQLQGVSQ